MKQKEVIDLIKIIDRCYKTDYSGDKEIINDWYRILKNYELNDIASSLDYYMKNYTNYPPKVYDIIKGYQSIEQKKILENAKTRCNFCGKLNKWEDNKEHEDKCRSIEFIKKAVKRFKKQDIDEEKYRQMDKEEFNKYYISALKLIINNTNNEQEKELCEKTLKMIE